MLDRLLGVTLYAVAMKNCIAVEVWCVLRSHSVQSLRSYTYLLVGSCCMFLMECALLQSFVLQATFEDELIEDAKAKRHSLTCEAVEIGSKVRKCCSAMC